jgi:hypothetical protein
VAAPELLTTIGGVAVRRRRGESAFVFMAGMTIDADGAPRAYHPALPGRPGGAPPGLDDLRNAGRPGNWFGIVTDAHGRPVVQRKSDPAPGFYVSATSLVNRGSFGPADPRRYVDASAIPFFVLPAPALHVGHARLGDFGVVLNRRNGRLAFAILADIGPKTRIGEGSACRRARSRAGRRAASSPSSSPAPATGSAVRRRRSARTGRGSSRSGAASRGSRRSPRDQATG